MIYLNNNKSWALVEFMLDTTNLKVKECFVKTSMQVITNSSGGEYNDNSAESEFIMRCMRQPLWTISLFLLVYILPLTIAALIKKVFNRKSKNKNIGDNFH